jgi:hypothetical protein
MSLQPLPTGTTHILSNDGLAFLPPFVRARLNYLADMLDWRDEDDEASFSYHEVRGMLSDGHYTLTSGTYVSPIHIWIASDDNCYRSLYVGGSSCWICPDSHDLYFDVIDPVLFPEPPDTNVWWCIHHEYGIKVVKIIVCPSEEITEDFPHGV